MSRRLSDTSKPFKLVSQHKPAGGQIDAIKQLISGLNADKRDQVLLGVTGSGKTFTMANIILQTQRPAIIMAHNKTLAAQLFSEMKSFFPNNAVEYFVSYYDYYQPEAYIAKTDTYIEKDSLINKKIEILRHSTTQSLMDRKDVIIVTSVSSIYGLGTPKYYNALTIALTKGGEISYNELIHELTRLNYQRNDIEFENGVFRVSGDTICVYPPYTEDTALKIILDGNIIEEMWEFDTLTQANLAQIETVKIYPATHYATPHDILKNISKQVLQDMKEQVHILQNSGKEFEAKRLEQRTRYDVEMMLEIGHFKGIENYSRYIDDRKPGEPPYTLFHYLPSNAIIFVDESHVTLPQIKAMYAGDLSRKQNLVSYGFRLPSALDNRPLKFEEWNKMRGQTVYVSATPSAMELSTTNGEVVEQVIRPTGLLDPLCEIRPLHNHFDDLINEIRNTSAQNLRTIVIVLTKKMAEKTHTYFQEIGIKSMYIHSNTDTLERVDIIQMLRRGEIEVIVGINLLREGIDIPECGLVAITDADKEGFLRSETALIQIVGRAARNIAGRVIFYADKETKAIKNTMSETSRRRSVQLAYNIKHNIIPQNIIKSTNTIFHEIFGNKSGIKSSSPKADKGNGESKLSDKKISLQKEISNTAREMRKAAQNLDFENAIASRKRLHELQERQLREHK